MNIRILKKTQPALWLSAFGLFGIMVICIRMAVALSGVSGSFTPQTMPTGSTSQEVATNSTLTSGTESLFRADFEKQYWSGNVFDYPINALGVLNTASERWSGGFAPNLEMQVNPLNIYNGALRYIGTMKDDGSKVPFIATSLSATQQNALAATVQSTNYTSTQIVDFLRGDHSLESLIALRQRFMVDGITPTALGDIIHSRPYYLADITNPTVFVGANDGMLHAIDVNTGTESWAYVPSMLLSKMKGLAANPYVHDYYVDGQIAVGFNNANARMLVGALGAGGKGLYALNIDGTAGLTAASDQFAANKVMWEITPTTVNYATPQMYDNSGYVSTSGYANLGYTLSAPLVKTIKTNNNGIDVPQRVVMVGNGYNNGGNFQAYLFIINADDGKLVRAIKADNASTNTTGTAVTQGTAASPNGLMNLLPFDSNLDGYIDTVYAGDLNGTMWKFNLSSATPSSWSSSVVYVTSPNQPITATPAALPHPSGAGYMVNFATGSIFTGTQPVSGVSATGDLADTSTFYVYGIWDGAPASNTTLVTPTLTERCYDSAAVPSSLPCSTSSSTVTRVRRISASNPNWATGGNKGWKVALPIGGERVVGDGSFISSGRYYFSTYNPTMSYQVPTTTTYVWGENWQMALDGVTGGSLDPFMDLNGDGVITSADLIKYTAAEAGTTISGVVAIANTPILTPDVDGIEVGKWVGRGVQSQPTLVKLSNLFTTLFNTNPDVTIPVVPVSGTGVTGGHFDYDIFFGAVTASAKASATITLAAQTAGVPASLGGITIGGSSVVPAMTFADGSQTSANATAIKNAVTGIYTATVSGSTVTLKAPVGSTYNGQAIVILPGSPTITPSPAVTSANASQSITFTNSTAINPTGVSITVNGIEIMSSTSPGSAKTSSQLAAWVASNSSLAGYTISNAAGTNVVTISANTAGPASNINSLSVTSAELATSDVSVGAPVPGVSTVTAVPGLNASRSITFTNGSNASTAGLSLSVNGTNILTSSSPGAQSTTGLATWVKNNSSLAGYTISSSGSTVTITSNTQDTTHNISSIAVAETTSTIAYSVNAAVAGTNGVAATPPSAGTLVITGVTTKNANTSLKCGATFIGATTAFTSINSSAAATRLADLYNKINGTSVNNYLISCTSPTNPMTCTVTPPVGASACSGGFTLTNITTSTNTGPSGGTNAFAGTLASGSLTFTNTTNITPTGLSVKVNGTEILTNTSPGSQSSSGLATWVKNNSSLAGYAISSSGSTVTITSNTADTSHNISTIVVSATTAPSVTYTIGAATTGVTNVPAMTSVAASRSFTFTNTSNINPTGFSVLVNGTDIMTSTTPSGNMSSSQLATWVRGNSNLPGYTITASGSTVTITANTRVASTWDINSITVSGSAPLLTSTQGAAVAGVLAAPAVIGQSNMVPAITTSVFSGGTDGSTAGDTCTGASGSQCKKVTHDHQYDKIYDVTGVDMLSPNDMNFILSRAIPNVNQNFKVIMQNQYLSPAIQLNIGNTNYVPNINFGYVSVRDYTTSATLDLATLPTYNQNPSSAGNGIASPKYIGSLVLNMPIDALTAKNWWGNGDVRAGLIPTTPGCVYNSVDAHDGNMYQPVIPPSNGPLGYPPDGPGTLGYSSSTTPATATGARHGGALTIEIIKDNTPNNALELQVSGRPEYGWRVISSLYSTYVLAEYSTYWHHPNGKCFNSSGWTKAPGPDTAGNPPTPTPRQGATDPKIGNLSGSSGSISSITIVGNTTTIVFTNGSSMVIIRVVNADGTVTTITVNIPGGTVTATAIVNSDRSVVVTVGGISATVAPGSSSTLSNGATISNSTTANTTGGSASGGLLNQNAIGYRRISWKELIRN